jgi:hypothetical protein
MIFSITCAISLTGCVGDDKPQLVAPDLRCTSFKHWDITDQQFNVMTPDPNTWKPLEVQVYEHNTEWNRACLGIEPKTLHPATPAKPVS